MHAEREIEAPAFHSPTTSTIVATSSTLDDLQSQKVTSGVRVHVLWVSYGLMTGMILTLLCVSFVRFHIKNKDRYRKREILVRYRSPSMFMIPDSGAEEEPDNPEPETTPKSRAPEEVRRTSVGESLIEPYVSITEVDQPTSDTALIPSSNIRTYQQLCNTALADDIDSISIGSCTSVFETDPEDLTNDANMSSQAQSVLPFVEKTILVSVSKVDPHVSTELAVGAATVSNEKTAPPRINCQQALTFTKRTSSLSLLSGSRGALGSTVSDSRLRWVCIRPDKHVIRNSSRNSLPVPISCRVDLNRGLMTSHSSGILSLMGTRMRGQGSRSVKLNMWSTSKARADKKRDLERY